MDVTWLLQFVISESPLFVSFPSTILESQKSLVGEHRPADLPILSVITINVCPFMRSQYSVLGDNRLYRHIFSRYIFEREAVIFFSLGEFRFALDGIRKIWNAIQLPVGIGKTVPNQEKVSHWGKNHTSV